MRAFDSGQRRWFASACVMHARQYVWPVPRSDTAEGAAVLACAEAWRGESLEMSAEEAGYLQRVAHEAVFGGDPPKL